LDWDIFFKPYVYEIYTLLVNRLGYEFKLGYIMTHASYSVDNAELLTKYEGIVTNTTKMIENTPTEIVLPYATALQNARSTYLTRFGSNIMDGAKLKNGFITEILYSTSNTIELTCDGTYDTVIFNNYNDLYSNKSVTLNGGDPLTWTEGKSNNLYVGCRPVERTSPVFSTIIIDNLQSGDTIVSKNNTGDYGIALMTDRAHIEDGIGCLICAYANVMGIFKCLGYNSTIVGSQIWPDRTFLTTHSIPATTPSYGLSKYNIWLAQQCAIMAMKKPLEITDMVAKGMCKAIEIYINNNDVISSNPILSADLNGFELITSLLLI
jgi:hypothetical protein